MTTPTIKDTLSSISIRTIISNRSSTESFESTPSDSYSDTASSVSINSSALFCELQPSIVASLTTSESVMNIPEAMKRRNQNLILSATSDESCTSTDYTGTATTTGTASTTSGTTISSEYIVTRVESFIKDTKLTSTSEYDYRI